MDPLSVPEADDEIMIVAGELLKPSRGRKKDGTARKPYRKRASIPEMKARLAEMEAKLVVEQRLDEKLELLQKTVVELATNSARPMSQSSEKRGIVFL